MTHYEHSTLVIIVRICGIIPELSAGRNRLSFLLSALLFVVMEFSRVPTFDRVVFVARSGRMAPPSTELPRSVPGPLLMVGIAFLGRLTVMTLFRSPSISSVEYSALL